MLHQLPVQVDHQPGLLLLLLLSQSRLEVLARASLPMLQLIMLQVLADTLLGQVAIVVVMLDSLATNTVDMDPNSVIFVLTNKLMRKGLSITNIFQPGIRLR